MKKLITIIICGICAAAGAAIETREVTFGPDEIPATNPRVARSGATVTHIEVFGAFETQTDGSVKTSVAETACDMDAVAAQTWIREAKAALGAAEPTKYSRIKLEIAIAKLGKYAALEAFLSSQEVAPGYTALTAWKSAQVIQDDFEGFDAYYAAVLVALGIDKETGDAILSQCLAD